jgi:hypothetical protein
LGVWNDITALLMHSYFGLKIQNRQKFAPHTGWIISISKNIPKNNQGAPLLGLAKSIYYILQMKK